MIIAIDRREKQPFDLSPYKTEPATLCTGDISIIGMEDSIRIERKNFADLVACVAAERERFEKCISRLLMFKYRSIICEGSMMAVELRQYRSQVHPNAILGSIRSWQMRGVSVFMAGSRRKAEIECISQLQLAYRSLKRLRAYEQSEED